MLKRRMFLTVNLVKVSWMDRTDALLAVVFLHVPVHSASLLTGLSERTQLTTGDIVRW